MREIIDSNGKTVEEGHWLVPKKSFEDGSYRFHPEIGYEVLDLDQNVAIARFNVDARPMDVYNGIYGDGYVAVPEWDFDTNAMREARKTLSLEKHRRAIAAHQAEKERLQARRNLPWWRRIFS